MTAERDYSTGKIYLTAQKVTDATLTHSLWQISVQGREVNSRVYSFKNKETGFELTFDHLNALQRGVDPNTSNTGIRIPALSDYTGNTDLYKAFKANYGWTYAKDGLMDGCNTWWAWYTSEENGIDPLGYKKVWSYFHNTDSVMALRAVKDIDHASYKNVVYHTGSSLEGYVDEALRDGGIAGTATTGYAIVAIKESKANAQDFLEEVTGALQIKPVVAGAKVLNAAEINTMIDADGSFLEFGKNNSDNIGDYDEWKDAGNKGASSTKFTVYDPKTGEPLDIYSNPFDYTFKAVAAGKTNSILERIHPNSRYAGYDVLFETKTPIDTDEKGNKKYGYLFVSEYPYEGQAFQGIYNGLQVMVAPYSYLDNPNTTSIKKKTVLQYKSDATYINNKTYPAGSGTGYTPDALQARYHWKVTYYATNDSVVLEPLNASRMSQSDFTQGKKFEETTLASASVLNFLNTINEGIAYKEATANANTMFNKAKGVPVALYAMNFGPSTGDVKSFLTVGYASGMTLDGKSAVDASNKVFAADWGNKVVSTNPTTGVSTPNKEAGNPAYVTNNTGYEYQSAMELLLRFNREYPYLQRATKETGLYFINLTNIDPSNAVTESYENGAYVVMDMGGHVVYDVAQKEQNFSHMPATQWVVEQQPCGVTTAEGNVNYNKYPTVRIYNREFESDPVFDGQLYVDDKGGLFTINHRYAKDAKLYDVDRHNYMKRTLNCNDFYVFNPVQDINTLGYFNEEEDVLRNSTYQFQHMFDMGVDKFLGIDNLKADMDTLRLVEDGADVASHFELFRSEGWYPTPDSAWVFNDVTLKKEYQPTGTYSFSYRDSLEYGYTSKAANAPQLYKTFYKIKVKDNNLIDNDHKFIAIKNQHKYVVADEATINSDPTLEFAIVSLKENNCLDGTHGYAFVNAPKIILAEKVAGSELKNLRKASEDALGKDLVDKFGNTYTVYYVDSNKTEKFEADKDKVMVTIYENGKLNKKQLTGKLAIEEISLDAKIAALCETTTSVFKLVNADRPLYRDLSAEYADLINNEKKVINLSLIHI